MSIINWLKKIFWTAAVPFFPIFRNLSKYFGYNPYPPRQLYALGFLNPKYTASEFKEFLKQKHFKKNVIAWIDQGEILSMRLLDGFEHQFHVRLFQDREIRGHYELTPEYAPLEHLKDVGTTQRLEDFRKILGDYLLEKLN